MIPLLLCGSLAFGGSPELVPLNTNTLSVKGMSRAYGFVKGQDYTLSRIKEEWPEFSMQVGVAKSTFDASFPEIGTKLETQLRHAMGQDFVQQLTAKLRADFSTTLASQQLTRPAVVQFIEQVKTRAQGDIESPVLEYLLAVKYANYPVAEFTDGFRQRYATDGTGKAQGIKMKLQLPRSWASKDGERPHIVHKWISENGTGLNVFMLDVRDVGSYNPSPQDMDNFVRSGEVRGSVPPGSRYVESGTFTLESRPGYWIHMVLPTERLGSRFVMEALMYQVYFRGKAIGLLCQAGGPESDQEQSHEAFLRIRPLCHQVANSIVLEQAY